MFILWYTFALTHFHISSIVLACLDHHKLNGVLMFIHSSNINSSFHNCICCLLWLYVECVVYNARSQYLYSSYLGLDLEKYTTCNSFLPQKHPGIDLEKYTTCNSFWPQKHPGLDLEKNTTCNSFLPQKHPFVFWIYLQV